MNLFSSALLYFNQNMWHEVFSKLIMTQVTQMYTYGDKTTKCLPFSTTFTLTFCKVNLLLILIWDFTLHAIFFSFTEKFLQNQKKN